MNYILYIYLFYANIITEKKEFKLLLPAEGNLRVSLVDTLSEYCILLNNELIKENIDSIEKFLNYAFVVIFPVFNEYNSFINLLNEEFTSDYYKIEAYPFYDYFYYSDYLNKKYINEKLMHID